MLNWAARYYPILRVLERHLNRTDSVLEIGSGSVGLGRFYPGTFVGCDVLFAFKPEPPMLPVLATATRLPFRDRSFDAVVLSDVLEHIALEHRSQVIRETLRVTRNIAIFGFPSGSEAFEFDRKLAEVYDRRNISKPAWLEEHMRHGFPTEQVFEDFKSEWQLNSFGNESVGFHLWMMKKEMRFLWSYAFRALLALIPRSVEHFLKRFDREPFYRRIVVARQR